MNEKTAYTVIRPESEYENLVNITRNDLVGKRLFRVTSLDRFIQMLDTKKNVLPKVETWDDPWEMGLFKVNRKYIDDKGNEKTLTSKETKDIRDSYYGQCWSENEEETDLTWKIFVANSGLCVRYSMDALYLWDRFSESSDKGCFAGKVKYKSDDELKNYFSQPLKNFFDGKNRDLTESLFFKRDSFGHEKEYRLIYFEEKKADSPIYEFDIDIDAIDDALVGSSKGIDEKLFSTVKTTLNKYGYTKEIERSTYYEFPQIIGNV